jgi:hypothetical protein
MVTDQVSEYLGISLGKEFVPAAKEFFAKRGVVFDDAIMDNSQLAGLIEMGMGIGIAGQSVCGPARVADAEGAMNWKLLDKFSKSGDAADAFANLEAAMVEQAKTGGVIASIFEPAQALNQQWRGIFFADVSDDAAHGVGDW